MLNSFFIQQLHATGPLVTSPYRGIVRALITLPRVGILFLGIFIYIFQSSSWSFRQSVDSIRQIRKVLLIPTKIELSLDYKLEKETSTSFALFLYISSSSTSCYDLRLSSGCSLGKDLRIEQERMQLVKHKDTEVHLHYIY